MNSSELAKENLTPVEVKQVIVRDNKIPPKVGATVMYVLAQKDSPTSFGKIRPAIIVDLIEDGSPQGQVTLQVFTDGGADQLHNVHRVSNVNHNEDRVHGTWHWPPPRELVFKGVPVEIHRPPPTEPEESSLEHGSPGSKYGEPGTTDWLDAGKPDHEKLEKHIAEKGYHVGEAPKPVTEVPPAAETSPSPVAKPIDPEHPFG